jgi:hypothetical protein
MTNWKSFLMGISQRAELDAKPMESNPTPCGEILGRVEGRVNKPGQLSPGAKKLPAQAPTCSKLWVQAEQVN